MVGVAYLRSIRVLSATLRREIVFCAIGGAITLGFAIRVGRLFQNQRNVPKADNLNIPTLSTPTIRFSSLMNAMVAQANFDKPEILYAFLEFPTLITGSHVVDVRWIRPDGMVQEASSIPMRFPNSGGRRADLWIRFHESGNVLDPFHGGPEEMKRVFNGKWTLETRVNGEELAKASFTITGY